MLIPLLGGTLGILVTHLALFVAFMGIGLIARRAFGLRSLDLSDCFVAFWMGFAGVILFSILWNFVFPVTGAALMLVMAAGGLGVLRSRHDLRAVFRSGERSPAALVVLLVLAGLWIGNVSMGALTNWDSALYHIQAIKWARAYPVVPGLANLHGPLGFNNASFLYDALLDSGPWAGRAYHLANGLLVFALLAQALTGAVRFFGPDGHRRPRNLFDFVLLAPAVTLVTDGATSSYATDVPATLVTLAAISKLYASLAEANPDPLEAGYGMLCVTTLLTAAVCIKTSAAAFAAACWPLAVLLLAFRKPGARGQGGRAVGWALAITLILGLAWIARGVVLSGYPLFPLPIGGLPVDWQVPIEHAEAEMALITHSGRFTAFQLGVLPGLETAWGWLPRWTRHHLARNPFEVVLPLGVAAVALALYGWARRRRPGAARGARGATARTWWILVPAALGIAAWFTSAPEPRYVMPLFWALAAVCAAQAFHLGAATSAGRVKRVTAIACLVLGVSPAIVNPVLVAQGSPIRAVLRHNLRRPGTDTWLQPLGGTARLRTFTTASGLTVNVPVRNGGRCWDAPLPCTPNPAPNLRLRHSETLAAGFAVDGGWQMLDWPWDWLPHFLPTWRNSREKS